MVVKSIRSLKISIGKALTKTNIRKAEFTSTKQRVNVLVSNGYEFRNDCIIWRTKELNDSSILENLYKIDEVIQNAGLGYHASIDENEKCIWLCEDSGE
jgi:hypothetical protein